MSMCRGHAVRDPCAGEHPVWAQCHKHGFSAAAPNGKRAPSFVSLLKSVRTVAFFFEASGRACAPRRRGSARHGRLASGVARGSESVPAAYRARNSLAETRA